MKIGITPLGNHALRRIIPQIKGSGFELSAVYSRDEDKAGEIAKQHNALACSSLDELCNSGIDAVYISSPNSLHYSQAKKFLEKNIHVLLEKQMTLSKQEADDLIDTARRRGVILGVGFHLRFHPALSRILELMRREEIGDLLRISGMWCGAGSSSNTDEKRAWWNKPEMAGGGSVMGTGVHVLDTIIKISGGKPERVYGWRHPKESTIENTFLIDLLYSRHTASMLSSREVEIPDNSLSIMGTEGLILSRNHFSTDTDSSLYLNGNKIGDFKGINMYHKELEAFRNEIDGKETLLAKGEDGAIVVNVVNSAVDSVLSGKSIALK